jgi:hypothetical protein
VCPALHYTILHYTGGDSVEGFAALIKNLADGGRAEGKKKRRYHDSGNRI